MIPDRIFWPTSSAIIGAAAGFGVGSLCDHFFGTQMYCASNAATAGTFVGAWLGNKYAESIDPHRTNDPLKIAEQYLRNNGAISLKHYKEGSGEYSILIVGKTDFYRKLDLIIALEDEQTKEKHDVPEFTKYNFFELNPHDQNMLARFWNDYDDLSSLGEDCEMSIIENDIDTAVMLCVNGDTKKEVKEYFRINHNLFGQKSKEEPVHIHDAIDGFLHFKDHLHYSYQQELNKRVPTDLEQF